MLTAENGSFVSAVYLVVFIGLIVFIFWLTKDNLRGHARELGLQKAAVIHASSLDNLKDIFLPMKRSTVHIIEPIVWAQKNEDKYIYLSSNNRRFTLRLALYIKHPINNLHVVLDSKANNIATISNLIRVRVPKSKLNTDGTFDDSFAVYAHEGQEVYALQIFSPDVLQDIMTLIPDFDVEIHDKQLAMVVPKGARSSESIENSMQAVRILARAAQELEIIRT